MTKNIKELWCKSKKTRQSVFELDMELRTIQLSNVRISFENRSPLFKLDTEIEKAADWFRIMFNGALLLNGRGGAYPMRML